MKKYIYTFKIGSWVEAFDDFLVVNVIDMHQLNLRKFGFF
jgi:hypothetical protein